MNWSTFNIKSIVTLCLVQLLLYTGSYAQMDTISFEHALANVEQSRLSKQGDQLAEALEVLAVRYLVDQELTQPAIDAYEEAIDVLRMYKDSAAMYDIYLSLAQLYSSIDQFHLAINLLDEAADFYAAKGDTVRLGLVLNFTADAFTSALETEQALPFVNDATRYSSASGLLTRLNSNTTTALIRNGVTIEGVDESDTTAIERSPTRTRLDSDYSGLVQLNNGYYQYTMGSPSLAAYYLRQATEVTADGVIERDALSYLAELEQDLGNYEQAFHHLSRYSAVNDSLLSNKRQQIINRLRIQMESYEQKAKISELESEKNVAVIVNKMQKVASVSLLIASLIILLGAYFAIRNYQKRLSTNQIIHSQTEEINNRRITDLENNLRIETMHSMITGQEAERERVSKELHDSLGGLLSTVKLHFDALQSHAEQVKDMPEYQKAHSLLDIACNEVRSIANNMQPDTLLSLGLVPAINDLVNRAQTDDTPVIEFQHFDVNGSLEPTAALNIYRIVQELLSNSLRHADASQILVQLIEKDGELMITVEDDGKGYDPTTVKKGMGTGNIESRVNFLKGELSIQASAGEGSSTLITVPVAE